MAKCRAKTKSGKACKAAAVGKTGRCLFHGPSNKRKTRSYNPGTSVVRAGPSIPRNYRRK